MKKVLVATICAAVMGWAGNTMAATYAFEDMIDNWGAPLGGVKYIEEGTPFTYTHDITDSVDFANGHRVTDAYLELDFTNDTALLESLGIKPADGFGQFTIFGGFKLQWDYREFVKLAFDGNGNWVDIGEQDNGQYTLGLNIDWLNDDGKLDVTIQVYNPLGTANAYLDHSRLYGTAATPEPTTMLLFGTGLAGLAAVGRRRKN